MSCDLVSIIVPVYNVEKYLKRCLSSIIAQKYSNIEIILIDDGSVDSSGKICDEYGKKDKRIRVFHKANGGLSSARNRGIEESRGNYIAFVDSDDWISSNYISILYENIKKFSADISACSMLRINDKGKKNVYVSLENKCFTPRDLFNRNNSTGLSACNKLYARSIFETIRFPVNKYFEDSFIYMETILKSKKIVTTSDYLYFYYINDNSITTGKFDLNVCIDSFNSQARVLSVALDNNFNSAALNVYFNNLYKWYMYSTKWLKKHNMRSESKHLSEEYHKISNKAFLKLSLKNKIKANSPFLFNFVKRIAKIVLFPIFLIRRKHNRKKNKKVLETVRIEDFRIND